MNPSSYPKFSRISGFLFFTWLAALLVLTYYPDLPEMKVRLDDKWFRLDYIGHFGFYAGLTALFLIWRAGWRAKIPGKMALLAIIGATLMAVATEFTQLAIPGRHFNPVDMGCNFTGALVGLFTIYSLTKSADK